MDTLPQTIGFVGLGAMGLPMATNVAAAGIELKLHDVNFERAEFVASSLGASPARSLAEVANAEVVLLSLPNADIVRSVVLGDDGLLSYLAEGSTIIDLSSSAPTMTVTVAGECARKGVTLIDAPVSGGVNGAVAGSLSVMVGGDIAVFERMIPLLELIGKSIFHIGPVGSAHALKALNNLLSAIGLAAAAEVIGVGERFGIDPEVMLDVLNTSTGRNNSTEAKIKPFVFSGTFDSGFSFGLMTKDILTAVDLAHSLGASVPVSAALVELALAARQTLPPDADHTMLALFAGGDAMVRPGSKTREQ